jgi:hypothetical protein
VTPRRAFPGRAGASRAGPLARARESALSLRAALRNGDIRRVECAWAVALFAEWAHLVALGVFAYHEGGASLVGVAGLIRLLPAGVLAPFASSAGDRVRRERLLVGLMVVEAAALGGSAVAALSGDQAPVLALGALIGATSTLVRPAVQSTLPSLARSPAELVASNSATSTLEGLGALCGPLAVGATVVALGTGVDFMATGAACSPPPPSSWAFESRPASHWTVGHAPANTVVMAARPLGGPAGPVPPGWGWSSPTVPCAC